MPTDDKKRYNYAISKARIVVENAFGRLKARWRRLMKRNDILVEHIPNVIAAACILHNVCETHGERFNEVWRQGITDDQSIQPSTASARCVGGQTKMYQRGCSRAH